MPRKRSSNTPLIPHNSGIEIQSPYEEAKSLNSSLSKKFMNKFKVYRQETDPKILIVNDDTNVVIVMSHMVDSLK